jgi:hypothetical protein
LQRLNNGFATVIVTQFYYFLRNVARKRHRLLLLETSKPVQILADWASVQIVEDDKYSFQLRAIRFVDQLPFENVCTLRNYS